MEISIYIGLAIAFIFLSGKLVAEYVKIRREHKRRHHDYRCGDRDDDRFKEDECWKADDDDFRRWRKDESFDTRTKDDC